MALRLAEIAFLALGLAGISFLPACPVQAAETVPDLYQGQTITTGTGARNRPAAFAECFVLAAAKASGDQRLLRDPAILAEARRASDYVRAFRYRDRLERRPIHDEQGSRDRPHVVTADFEPARMDAFLKTVGGTPWTGPRPSLALLVRMDFGAATYPVLSGDDRSRDPAEAVAAAAKRVGMPVRLPGAGAQALVAEAVGALYLKDGEPPAARRAREALSADLALIGDFRFEPKKRGWVARFGLFGPEAPVRWAVSGVNYDEAFRNGLRGAAQYLSGHGNPASDP